MSNRGIEALLCINNKGKERILRRNRAKIFNWDKPIWVNNELLEHIPDFDEIIDIHTNIMSMSERGRIMCISVKQFSTNDNTIEVDKLYSEVPNLHIAFLKNRNAMRLIIIPSKTRKEIVSAGVDRNGKYNFPLLLSLREKKYEQVNLF